MAIAGLGYSFGMVSTFTRAQGSALQKGFKDDIETYILISGTDFIRLKIEAQVYFHFYSCANAISDNFFFQNI